MSSNTIDSDSDEALTTNAEKAAVLPQEIGEVIGQRNGSHGDPLDNHDHIARLWSEHLGVAGAFPGDDPALARPITGDEVADMMMLLKLSRKRIGGMDLDHYRDTIGYAAIASLYVPGYDPEVPAAEDEPETDGGHREPPAEPIDPRYEEVYQNLRAGEDR